jgi:hypothetical protein
MCMMGASAIWTAAPLHAQALPAASEADGKRYAVMNIEVGYDQPNPPLPPIRSLVGAAVKLGRTEGGYVAWRVGLEPAMVRLDAIGNLPDFMMYDSALDLIKRTLIDELSQRGIKDAKVAVAAGQFDEQGRNLREADDFNLRLVVSATAPAGDGYRIPVTGVELRYQPDNLVLPPLKPMLGAAIQLGATEGGYVAWREGLNGVKLPIHQLDRLPDFMMFQSAVDQMAQSVQAQFEQRGIKGATVKVAPNQVEGGKDLRESGDYRLLLEVNVGATGIAALEAQRYPVMSLSVAYADPKPWLPLIEIILNAPVKLGRTESGFMAWRDGDGLDPYRVKIAQLAELPDFMHYRSSLDLIAQAIVDEFAKHGYLGVTVSIDPSQIAADGADQRPKGDYGLSMIIDTSKVRSSNSRLVTADGRAYPVKALEIAYTMERGKLPDPNVLMDVTIPMAHTESGLAAWREGMVRKDMKLAEIAAEPDAKVYGSAIRQINQAIVTKMNELGFFGVIVAPAPGQFDETGADQRGEIDQSLKLVVKPGVVQEVRTVAGGDRVKQEERVNNAVHQRIAGNSPIQQGQDGQAVLNRSELDRYVQWLNRHPGRRVDVAVAAGNEPGSYVLDYLVQDTKPWMVYFQASNTGTQQTSRWRERIGFVTNQLTNQDDVLRFDYVTSSFEDSHAFVGAYEAPFPGLERLRWKVEGTYSQFVASDVGVFNVEFEGKTFTVGGELAWNFFQAEDFFVDLVGGILYQNTEMDGTFTTGVGEAEAEYLRPRGGIRAERRRTVDTFFASVMAETNLLDNDLDATTSGFLGRVNSDDDFSLVHWDASYSTYIEPWLKGQQSNLQPEVSMLVHELSFSVRGQHVLDEARLASQLQYTAGGLYTVRGYKEAATVGDDAIIATAEYRLHAPRLFGASEPGKVFGEDFKWAPQNEYSWPDWDLIAKAFVDYGRTSVNDPVPGEENQDLLGAGVGLELQLKRNFNIRIDWAWALKEIPGTTEGSSQIHIVGTILY